MLSVRPVRYIFLIQLFPIFASYVCAQQVKTGNDSLSVTLDEVVVDGRKSALVLQPFTKGRTRWKLSSLSHMPQILGNADPMRYAQTLPGIQTNNEYDTGLHVYGCDNTHNFVGVEGVPLYNVNHLLGFFSSFNASHYASMNLQKVAADAAFPNRLGGMLMMELPREVADSVAGEVSVGLISSQGTIRVPTGRHSSLAVSARASYLNLLYGYALKVETGSFKYSFWDTNLTWTYTPSAADRIWVDAYWGGDQVNMKESDYLVAMKLNWNNRMLAAHWEHCFSQSKWKHSAYYTAYHNTFGIDQEIVTAKLPSSIIDFGYKTCYQWKTLRTGLEAVAHTIRPQSAVIEKGVAAGHQQLAAKHGSQEYAGFVDWGIGLFRQTVLDVGVRGSLFVDAAGKLFKSINPSVCFTYYGKSLTASATVSYRHQYIFQTGFSSKGFPTEFWTNSDGQIPPQKGLNLSLSGTQLLLDDTWSATVEAYYKRLNRIVEYKGTILDFVFTDYQLKDHLLCGEGENYGVNFMLAKRKGKLTGWVSYAVGRALRRFSDSGYAGRYPSNHERIHELNAFLSYRLGKRWNVGATYVFASGTPFTAPKEFYIYSGRLVAQYGEHNACRLDPYARLDLSVEYKWKMHGRRESGLNFSIYNTLANSNELFWMYRINRDQTSFTYKPVSFLVRVLPSVSYYVKF